MRALIATDGSPASLEAARRAGELLSTGFEFVVVSVIPPREEPGEYAGGMEGPLLTPEAADAINRAAAAEAETALAATARVLGSRAVEQRIEQDDAGETICSLAIELDADVVVVGSRGKGVLRRGVLGSVSTHVVHHCRRPVLVVTAPD